MIGQQSAWQSTQYSDHIIKLTYQPANYTTQENISDAVILKPKFKKKIQTQFVSTSAIINNELSIDYVEKNDHKGFRIKLKSNEAIYGGGERALPLNRKGYAFNLHNNPWYGYGEGADNLNFSVPFFTSSMGYGLFFDNPSSGKVDIGRDQAEFMDVTFSSGQINVYVIYGKSPKDILRRYHDLTGTQGLPPRWVLGNFMSRFGYTSEKQIDEVASAMQKENIPFDAMIIDLFWFGDSIKGTMGNLEWVNKTKWPDPAAMISKYKKQNIKTLLITEPFILQSSTQYEASLPFLAVDKDRKPYVLQDFYFGKGGLIDIFKHDAQDWFWSKHDQQNKIGVAAWWGDLGEPEKHPSDLFHDLKDMGHQRLFGSHEVHNIYGHFWTKMLYKNYEKYYPDTRLFSLNRSGFAGSQRYSIFPWSGDVSRSWGGMRAQLPIMLGMSMSGIPYIHSDAGGFAGGEGDYELYVRWLQMCAFTPIFRPHGSALYEVDKSSPSFPSEPALVPSPFKEMAADVVRLRYSMLAYNYTLSYLQAVKGKPLVAPLYYYFPDDSKSLKIEDQYLWGESIIVAPILQKSATERKVYLPEQNLWYPIDFDFKSGIPMKGETTVQTKMNELLLFIKEGSFIPLIVKIGKTSEDFRTDTLTLHYFFSDQSSTYTLFDDDGLDKNSIAKGKYELITFQAKQTAGKLRFDVSSNKGQFSTKPKSRFIKLKIHGDKSYKSGKIIMGKISQKIMNISELGFDFNGQSVSLQLSN
jgi:oligosaccharide 4-alpha-D-glucosyltransferase